MRYTSTSNGLGQIDDSCHDEAESIIGFAKNSRTPMAILTMFYMTQFSTLSEIAYRAAGLGGAFR
jgi:hypothetical protein